MQKPYPSDITCAQFEVIAQDLAGAKKTTKPRIIDLYEVFCVILYTLPLEKRLYLADYTA